MSASSSPPRGAASSVRDAGLRAYLAEVSRVDPPGADDERRLLLRARLGDLRAADALARAYLPVVAETFGEAAADGDVLARLERGNAALVDAIRTFPWSGSSDFGAYVRRRVRAAVRPAAALAS